MELINLHEFIEQTIKEYNSEFFSKDRVLPESFKQYVKSNAGGEKFDFREYTTVVSSDLSIYCPNQWFYIAAYYCKLYPVLAQYKNAVFQFAKIPDSSKDNKEFFAGLVGNKLKAEEIFLNSGLPEEQIELLVNFVSNYNWWRGGKGIERNDFYYSPILSAAALVNQSQSYVAEICKYLVENPIALEILNGVIQGKNLHVEPTLISENRTLVVFMENCVRVFLQYDPNFSKAKFKINSVTVGFAGCPIGKLLSAFQKETDPRRKDDCNTEITWSYEGRVYCYWKEQSIQSFKVFQSNFNEIYKDKYQIIEDNGIYKLMELSLTDSAISQTQISISTAISPKYRQFLTAIKSKPFLLLAGISGTGKSRIVRELARSCWNPGSDEYKAQKPKNFEMIQVKPNWHDSSELIGYVSRIDGIRFVVGPFLRFMVKAMADPETPYFLCLDEMNLAPVEQYFAEYLSVIESRKCFEDGTVVTDPIIDYSDTEEYGSLIRQLFTNADERELYLTREGGKRLTIPQNLIVVGTVNMDETTFSFSRKVLDRAMTIEMNEVDLNGGLDKRYEQIGKLSNAELIGTAVEGVDVYNAYKAVCDQAIAYLKSVNDKLERTPFKIAYRTRNETLLYVVNNLPYNIADDGTDLDSNYVIARALDEITNMKILSRIEGDESKVSNTFLEDLENTIKQGLEAVYAGPFEKDDTNGACVSISLAKLDEMKKRLASSGYTSFWS